MVHVHNFVSYFWIECPPELNPTPNNLDMLKAGLNVIFQSFSHDLSFVYRQGVHQ